MSEIIELTTAGAGSGKTTELTRIIRDAVESGECRAGGIIATTFTNKAAGELVERVRQKLFESGRLLEAQQLDESLLGTVDGICARLLGRFAFEAGISPQITVIDKADSELTIGAAIEEASSTEVVQLMQRLGSVLGQQDDKTGKQYWKEHVGAVIKAVRENGINIAKLPAMAETSISELAEHLPPVTYDDLNFLLATAIQQALSEIDDNGDATDYTRKSKAILAETLKALKNERMTWVQWWRVAKTNFGAGSRASAAPAQEMAGRVEEHPQLRLDLADHVRGVFSIAGEALNLYQRRKEERGWLDFGDLESRTLALLNNPDVAAVISAEFDLLLVDEFQDTSPLQLALFLRLAELVKVRTVWVGDVKQAIYGFRGSDPALMDAAVDLVRAKSGMKPPLSKTYRARPDLAAFLNGVFVPAFGKHGLAEAEVRLEPDRKEHEALPPPLERWILPRGEKEELGSVALAEGVARLLSGGYQIADRHSKTLRPLLAGDVAVLCRTNDNAAKVARCLIARGIDVTLDTPGLLGTPEACLAMASLRRLLDPGDSLAAAEIIALEGDRTPEQWLSHRLDWLQTSDKSGWGLEGDLIHPALLALEEARKNLILWTPLEALDSAIGAAAVMHTITAWGPTPARVSQRRANLEALRGFAMKYEDRCASIGQPATVAGFLLWCNDLKAKAKDSIAAEAGPNAVCVHTWHGAKGLEWPVVICSDLEKEPRPRIWDQVVVVQESKVDPHAPLASRRLRFWPRPFGQQKNGVSLRTKVLASEAGRLATKAAEQEELRLLYVAFTRARDVLVLPFRHGENAKALAPLDASSWLTPPDSKEPLTDGPVGEFRGRTRVIVPPESVTAPHWDAQFNWFPAAAERIDRLPAALRPHEQPAVAGAVIGEVVEFGGRISIRGKCEDLALGDGLHSLIAFHLLHPGSADRQIVADRLLKVYGISGSVGVADALAMCDAFASEIQRRFKPSKVLVEVPFTYVLENGQTARGAIDLILETEGGWVVIDHKTFLGSRADWPARAASHSGQLALYRAACRATGSADVVVWVHFVTGGGLVEVVIP